MKFYKLDLITDGKVCVLLKLVLALLQLHASKQITPTLGVPADCERIFQSRTRWDGFLYILFSLAALQKKKKKKKEAFSCFFIFSYVLFSPTLTQGYDVASFNSTVKLLAYQSGGGLVNFLLPRFFKYSKDTSPHIHMYTRNYTCTDLKIVYYNNY